MLCMKHFSEKSVPRPVVSFRGRSLLILMFAPVLFILLAAVSLAAQKSAPEKMPAVLPWSQQISVREDWLEKHHALLLAMMRKHNVAMWLVVNEEFHDDPNTEYVAPPRVYTGNRDIFVFIDAGDQGLKKYAVTGYSEESLKRFFETEDDPRPAKVVLQELYAKYQPKTIALGYGGSRGVTRSITHDSYEFLAGILGPEAAQHFVPAAGLIEDYLSTRISEEFETYLEMVRATEILTRRALSNEVIKPGTTKVGDIRRWLYDQLWLNHYTTWFQPDVRLQRQGLNANLSRGFLGVAPDSLVIELAD